MSIISRSSCLHLLFLGQTSAKCLSLHWPVLVLTVHSLRVRKERIMMHALSGYSSPSVPEFFWHSSVRSYTFPRKETQQSECVL